MSRVRDGRFTLVCIILVVSCYLAVFRPETLAFLCLNGVQDANSAVETFFNRTKILAKLDLYSRRCNDGYSADGIFGAVLENGKGFASVLNNALNAYVLATEPGINRTFRLLLGKWIYSPLDIFFEDIYAGTNCHLFERLEKNDDYRNAGLSKISKFSVIFDESAESITLTANQTAVFRYARGHEWNRVRQTVRAIVERDGVRAVFERKSTIARAVWMPNKRFKAVIAKAWLAAADTYGRFFAVHIRRGDKITSGQGDLIETAKYFEKIEQVCIHLGGDCPSNVLLMSDDPVAIDEFKSMSSLKYHVKTTNEISELLKPDLIPFASAALEKGSRIYEEYQRKFMDEFSAEFYLSLSLMSMSDHLFCTHSSNICRLLDLLKGNKYHKQVTSLDLKWYAL